MDQTGSQRKEQTWWDRTARTYDQKVGKTFQDTYDRTVNLVRDAVLPSDRVLEIACGTGIVTLAVAPYVAHLEATDLSPIMLAIAEAKAHRASVKNITFRVADGYSLPFEDGSFDVVLAFNVLHVVTEPRRLIAEARRLLKPGGLLASATDCYAEPMAAGWRLKFSLMWLLRGFKGFPFLSRFKRTDVEQLLTERGFVIERRDELYPALVNYYLLGRKV